MSHSRRIPLAVVSSAILLGPMVASVQPVWGQEIRAEETVAQDAQTTAEQPQEQPQLGQAQQNDLRVLDEMMGLTDQQLTEELASAEGPAENGDGENGVGENGVGENGVGERENPVYDHGMDPFFVGNPADTPNRPTGLGLIPPSRLTDPSSTASSDDSANRGWISDYRPQFSNPMFPNGRDHLPKATIDLEPQVLARLSTMAKVDGERVRQINAYSPSMGRTIPLIWIVPQDLSQPRPVTYVLSGADGGGGWDNWMNRTDIIDFYSSRNVHVILPALGGYSFYSDWLQEFPDMGGKQMWETFMTHELPEPLEQALGTDGKRSLIGMSMSGTSAILYATHQPNFYDSVISLSGCGDTNSYFGRRGVASTMWNGNGTPMMMWGEPNSDYSRYQDAVINAERLAEQDNMYVYAASGLIGVQDLIGPHSPGEDEGRWKDRLGPGFFIEAASNLCAHRLKRATDSRGITENITYDFATTGTHSWDAWNNTLSVFWPIQARGFGIDGGPIPTGLDTEPSPLDLLPGFGEGSSHYPDIIGGASSRVFGRSSVPNLSSYLDEPLLSTRLDTSGSSQLSSQSSSFLGSSQ